jgi:hypothetical protein
MAHTDPEYLAELEKETEFLNAKGRRGNDRIALKEAGDSALVRLVPYQFDEKGRWYARVARHWINQRPYICTRDTDVAHGGDPDGRCQICELVDKLNRDRDRKVSQLAYKMTSVPQYLTMAVLIETMSAGGQRVGYKGNDLKRAKELWLYKEAFQDVMTIFKTFLRRTDSKLSILDPIAGCDLMMSKSRRGLRFDREDPIPLAPKSTNPDEFIEAVLKSISWKPDEPVHGDDLEDLLLKIEDTCLDRRSSRDEDRRGGGDDRGRARGDDDRRSSSRDDDRRPASRDDDRGRAPASRDRDDPPARSREESVDDRRAPARRDEPASDDRRSSRRDDPPAREDDRRAPATSRRDDPPAREDDRRSTRRDEPASDDRRASAREDDRRSPRRDDPPARSRDDDRRGTSTGGGDDRHPDLEASEPSTRSRDMDEEQDERPPSIRRGDTDQDDPPPPIRAGGRREVIPPPAAVTGGSRPTAPSTPSRQEQEDDNDPLPEGDKDKAPAATAAEGEVVPPVKTPVAETPANRGSSLTSSIRDRVKRHDAPRS